MPVPPGDRSFLLTPSCRFDGRSFDYRVEPSGSFLMTGRRDAMSCGPLDEHGQPLFEVLNVVTFVEHAGGTIQTVRAHVRRVSPGTTIHLAGMEAGWSQSLERLGDPLARSRPLYIAGSAHS